jgi:hypothetical protein
MNGKKEKRYGKAEVLKVLDELYLIYISKQVYNMFRVTAISNLSRILLIHDEVLGEILDVIVKDSSGFLNTKENRSGPILQMQTVLYKKCR